MVRSTLAGETLAMSDGFDNTMYLATLFSKLSKENAEHGPPTVCVTDNHSLVDVLRSTKSVSENRLHLEISSIK